MVPHLWSTSARLLVKMVELVSGGSASADQVTPEKPVKMVK